MAVDKTTFRATAFDGVTVTFDVEAGKTMGIALKQGPNTKQQTLIMSAADVIKSAGEQS